MFSRQKIKLEDSTISNWFRQGGNLLEPLYQAHERRVLTAKYSGVDETPIKVLDKTKKGTTHQGYYWVYYNTQSRQVLFKYQTGRAAVWPKETLKNYNAICKQMGMQRTINLTICKVLLCLIAGHMPAKCLCRYNYCMR